MNRIFLFSLLILFYLAMAKLLFPIDLDVNLISSVNNLKKIIHKKPAVIILVDSFETGFFIKSYYHKYRVVYGFDSPEEIVVKTNKSFAKENNQYLGLALYQISDKEEILTPNIPGSILINDPAFGQWETKENGVVQWEFYRAYNSLNYLLGWKGFVMNKLEYLRAKQFMDKKKAYFGYNHEFGIDGEITKSNFPHFFHKERQVRLDFHRLLKHYIALNLGNPAGEYHE